MASYHSFTEYVKKRFDNNFWAAAESYLEANFDSLGIELRRIHRAGETDISDVKVEHIWVEDKPGMEIYFDVAVSIWFETHEGDYHYDDYDENIVWMMVNCRGNLEKNLMILRFCRCRNTMEKAAQNLLWMMLLFQLFHMKNWKMWLPNFCVRIFLLHFEFL